MNTVRDYENYRSVDNILFYTRVRVLVLILQDLRQKKGIIFFDEIAQKNDGALVSMMNILF